MPVGALKKRGASGSLHDAALFGGSVIPFVLYGSFL